MRTVYLGTSEFAAAILRRLYDSSHRPTLVVSRPDSPQGRGRKLTPPPTVVLARELGLEVIQPERVNGDDVRARISADDPDRLVVCAYGALIKGVAAQRPPHPERAPVAVATLARRGPD